MARRTADRVPLSRERILRAGVALADAEGIESLTMRGLAGRLGVEAMSLYNHVADKDDLLDGMIDLIACEIDAPSEGGSWRSTIRQRAVSTHDTLLRHPWSSILWASRTNIGPGRVRHLDAMLRDLRRAGFQPGLLDVAFHALENHIVGHARQHASFPFDDTDLPAMSARYLEDFPSEDHPDLAAHIRHHLDGPDDVVSSFEFALDAILDALEHAADGA